MSASSPPPAIPAQAQPPKSRKPSSKACRTCSRKRGSGRAADDNPQTPLSSRQLEGGQARRAPVERQRGGTPCSQCKLAYQCVREIDIAIPNLFNRPDDLFVGFHDDCILADQVLDSVHDFGSGAAVV